MKNPRYLLTRNLIYEFPNPIIFEIISRFIIFEITRWNFFVNVFHLVTMAEREREREREYPGNKLRNIPFNF